MISKMMWSRAFVAAAIVPFGGYGIAVAQTTAAPTTTDRPLSAPTAPVSGAPIGDVPSAGAGTQEIVVTAQRRAQNLQQVPLAVTAYNSTQLANTGVRNTRDLTLVTPALNFTQSSFAPQATIRGVGTRGVGAGDESVVPIFIDGVYQPYIFASITDLVDVDRVEVLRGPQSTLYGRNATGGAINILTRDPINGFTAEGGIRYGRFDETDTTAYVSGGNDTFGVSAGVRWRRDDGYSRNIITDDRVAKTNDVSAHAKAVWKPTERLKVVLSGEYVNINDNTATSIRPLDGDTQARIVFPTTTIDDKRYTIANSFDDYLHVKMRNVALSGTLELAPFDIRDVTSYTYGFTHGISDTDATPAPFSVLDFTLNSKSVYQELYLTSNGSGPISYTAGGVYYHDRSRAFPSVGIATAISGATFGQTTQSAITSAVTTNSYAAYAQLDWKFASRWTLSVGGRYTDERKSFITQSATTNMTTGASSALAPQTNAKTFHQFTPTGTLTFQPNADVNLYVRAGKGFKSGIFNTSLTNTIPVRPERIEQYEAGAKLILTSTLRMNLAGYYSRQQDVQLTARDPVTGLTYLQNAASTRIYGFEGELFWHPVQAFNLRANMSLLHGKYTSFPTASVTIPATTVDPVPATACVPGTGPTIGGNRSLICDVTGNSIIRTPFVTANLSGDYTIPIGDGKVVLSGNIFYTGHSYWDPLNRLREKAYETTNLFVNWLLPGGRYQIGVGGDNVFNSYHYLSVVTSAGTDNVSDSRPATYYVQLRAKF